MSEATNLSELSAINAIGASLAGDHHRAVWAMQWLLYADARLYAPFFTNHASIEVRLDYLRALAGVDARMNEIFRPCPILGRAGEKLEPIQRGLIEQILNAHWAQWEGNEVPRPRHSNLFEGGESFPPERMPSLTVATVFAKHIHSNPAYIETDFYHHFYESALSAGLKAARFAADKLVYDRKYLSLKPEPTRPLSEEIAELTAFLEATKPDLVVFDGNYVPTENTIEPQYWIDQKQRLGFKLLTVVGDCYDGLTVLRWWKDCSDAILGFHPNSVQLIDVPHAIVLPNLPFDDASFNPSMEKDIGVLSIGSATRDRPTWTAPLEVAGVPVHSLLHDRSAGSAPSRAEYYSLLGRSKLTFNNGYVTAKTNILTGRFFEGLLSRSLVLQEVGAPVEDYFSPYIHYVPVANVDQLISFARFFMESEPWRARIADAALDWWHQHYTSAKMWRFLCSRLFAAAAPPAQTAFDMMKETFSSAREGKLAFGTLVAAANRLEEIGARHLAVALFQTWLVHTEAPQSHLVCYRLGVMLRASGDAAGAEEAFRRALTLNPGYEEARVALGTGAE
jgi:hypothetical protein